MAAAIVRGMSRAVWRRIAEQSPQLLGISLLPAGAILTCMALYIFTFALILKSGVQIPFVPNSVMVLYWVVSLLQGFLLAWWFVRIVRLRRGRPAGPLQIFRGEAKHAFWVFLYGLFTFFIAAIPLLPLNIATYYLLFQMNSLGQPVQLPFALGAALILGSLATFVFAIWLASRFAVALPLVAAGQRPNLFREVWPMSKGNSWALPMRLVGWNMLYLGLLLLLMVPFLSLMAKGLIGGVTNGQSQTDAIILLSIRSMPLYFLILLLEVPLVWFNVLLLCEASERFARRHFPDYEAAPKY